MHTTERRELQMVRSMKNWIALFSFTGTELSEVIKAFPGRIPQILTNSNAPLAPLPYPLLRYTALEINFLLEGVRGDTLVTLHGYNRILPDRVVNNPFLEIYNTHPGDVLKYPELVGKDPQKKALELGLTETGVTIHRVTPNLDQGPAIRCKQENIYPGDTEETLSDRLRNVSIKLWISFLKEKGL